MTAWYNEIDPYAAAWLRNLIEAGHIAPGVVDERSIEDIPPSDLHGFTQCHFFAGVGVWSAALRAAGVPDTAEVWTGSCPCQPFSAAGKGAGFADERHLWPAWQWLIAQLLPPVVFGEQVASKDGLAWLDLVQTDMEALDYACGATVFPAAGVGAPHIRHRTYFVADTRGASIPRSLEQWTGLRGNPPAPLAECCDRGIPTWFLDSPNPLSTGAFDGGARPVGIVRACGNAICLPQAQAFIESYMSMRKKCASYNL